MADDENEVRIDERELADEFVELVSIDAESFSERGIADVLIRKLEALGFTVSEDNAGSVCGSSSGNLFATLPGTLPGPAILLVAHLDTVRPGRGKRAVFHDDGTITSDGTTVLGADDVCGLVEILAGVRAALDSGVPRRGLELLLPVAEEPYDRGSSAFDPSVVTAREAYVLDLGGAVGTAALAAPSIVEFSLRVHGKSAHAGFEPEKGVHAIRVLSEIIASLDLGRVGEGTTVNVGTVVGGKGSNIVSALAVATGEIRSFSHGRALEIVGEIRSLSERVASKHGASVELEHVVRLHAYETRRDAGVVRRFQRQARRLGLEGKLTRTFGGSDNNNLARWGVEGVVLSCGMYLSHTTSEYTTRRDLVLGARLVFGLVTDWG